MSPLTTLAIQPLTLHGQHYHWAILQHWPHTLTKVQYWEKKQTAIAATKRIIPTDNSVFLKYSFNYGSSSNFISLKVSIVDAKNLLSLNK